MTINSVVLLIYILGVLICFEIMFRVFERAEVGFSTTDIYFAVVSAVLALIWPVYVPWTLIRRYVNTRKLKSL